MQIQEHLFQRIREKLPANLSLADAIAQLLHVSTDSAYRRIRGETPLILEEAKILCDQFSISLDHLLKLKNNSVIFTPAQINNEHYSFENYLNDILGNLQYIASFRQKEIIYLSKDLTLFHIFSHPALFAFKYFFWMKSILQHPDFATTTFSPGLLTPSVQKTGTEVLKIYNTIPSTEIWNTECINSLIAQVEHYREAGYFASLDDVHAVYDAIGKMIEHLKNQAETGCKYMPGESPDLKKANFSFFFNRVVLGDNTIMVLLDGRKTLYLNYDVLNYMVTQDEKFCNDTYAKLQMLMRRATILSSVSERQRNLFFNTLIRKIPRYEKAVSNPLP